MSLLIKKKKVGEQKDLEDDDEIKRELETEIDDEAGGRIN